MDIIKLLVNNIIPISEKSMQDNAISCCTYNDNVDRRRPCAALVDCHFKGSYVADYWESTNNQTRI